jgi:ABC-2 type transport system permease protein
MKTTIRIAKLELSTLFYSPIAWFLLIVFLFQCGLSFTSGSIANYVTYEALGSTKDRLEFLTTGVFGYPYGMFPDIMSKLYLYIPLLTMGLMSREISSGTIKLLYSSPVKVSEIIFGKYLSMMVYNLILTLVLGLFVATGCLTIVHADTGQLLSALLGVYLLLCAYAAIGLFMSCLTSYQVVAALSTFVVFALLAYIGTIWQDIDFVRDLTYSLSISNRVVYMVQGLISTKDVFYFLIIIYIFLGLCILKLRADRGTAPFSVQYGKYAALVISAVLFSYLSSRPALVAYYDATANKTQTLTVKTQAILKEIGNSPLEVTSYINLIDNRYWRGMPSERNNDMARWERYLRFKPDINFKYVYYYDSVPNPRLYKNYPGKTLRQIAENYATSYGVDLDDFKSPAEIKKIIDLAPEQNRYVMQLKYRGKTTFLRLFDDMEVWPSESETSAALKRMTVKLPRIAFLTGEQERSITQFSDKSYRILASDITFRFALINQGFDIESLSLKSQEIPADIAVLVIADPQEPFSPGVLAKITRYMAAGGNILIAGEPDKQAVLAPLLRPMGVAFLNGMIIQPGKDLPPDLALTYITNTAAGFSTLLKYDWQDSLCVAMPGASGLSYDTGKGFDIHPLLMTDGANSWLKKGMVQLDSTAIGLNPAKGDEKKAFPTALALSRTINNRRQRIIVAGDADFLDIIDLYKEHLDIANYHFNTALFGWLCYGKFPIDTTRPKSKDNHLSLTRSGLALLKYIFLGILPGILLVIGTVLLIRRKRK